MFSPFHFHVFASLLPSVFCSLCRSCVTVGCSFLLFWLYFCQETGKLSCFLEKSSRKSCTFAVVVVPLHPLSARNRAPSSRFRSLEWLHEDREVVRGPFPSPASRRAVRGKDTRGGRPSGSCRMTSLLFGLDEEGASWSRHEPRFSARIRYET